MLIDERKHPQKLQWDDQGANTMTDKITIERETLERAIADYDAAAGNDGALLTLVRARTALFDLLRAALAAQPAEPVEPVAWIGLPGKGTPLFTAPPAPAAVPPGYALVPIEPTPEMCKIGGHVMSEWTDDSAPLRERTYAVAFADAYRAMIAAAGDNT